MIQLGTLFEMTRRQRWLLVTAAVLAAVAGFFLHRFQASEGQSHPGPLKFVMHSRPAPVPNLSFVTADGASMKLEDWRGKVVLLNVWATWCPPCKQEMPSLDRLQAKVGGTDFEVIALSIDKDANGRAQVKSFYSQVGIRHLRIFQDPTGAAGFSLATVGVPTTLLIDRQGREVGRLTGTAEWDSPAALDLVRKTIAAPQGKP